MKQDEQAEGWWAYDILIFSILIFSFYIYPYRINKNYNVYNLSEILKVLQNTENYSKNQVFALTNRALCPYNMQRENPL